MSFERKQGHRASKRKTMGRTVLGYDTRRAYAQCSKETLSKRLNKRVILKIGEWKTRSDTQQLQSRAGGQAFMEFIETI